MTGRACAPIDGATAETHEVGAPRSRPCTRGDRAGPLRHDLAGRLQRGDRNDRRRVHRRRADGDGSVELRAARCRFRDPAGQAADRRGGVVVRLRCDQVRLPVVPLRHGRRALQVDPRRDRSHLHARRQGRRADARLRRARDRQDGNDEGVREPRRTGCRTARQARLDRPADGHRRAQGRSDAPGLGRQLEPDPDHDRVPVAALQPERPSLQAAPRSDREHLRRHRRRHRARPARRRPRDRWQPHRRTRSVSRLPRPSSPRQRARRAAGCRP